jgi:hypothetical protein
VHTFIVICTVTYRSIARQQLCKHIPTETNARNNRTSIVRQRTSKHASLTIEAVFSTWSMQNGYERVFGSIEQSLAKFEEPVCQDMILGTEELN